MPLMKLSGRVLMKTQLVRCVTPQAQQVIQKAFSTLTALQSFTLWQGLSMTSLELARVMSS